MKISLCYITYISILTINKQMKKLLRNDHKFNKNTTHK